MAKNNELDAKEIEARVHDLSKSMIRIKSKQAERDDVVVEMKHSERTRLELLARDLQGVFDDIPQDCEQFEFALTKGETPRLWVDMNTHVRMGADQRQYELVKDTRMGRTILATTTDMNRMGGVVTDYVADKLLERERMLEGEWVSLKGYDFEPEQTDGAESETANAKSNGWQYFLWFIVGALIASGALFALIKFDQLPAIIAELL